jgi:signal transduction histidine kinase
MGVFIWPGPDRSRAARPSIRLTFAAMVAVPIAFLVLLWLVLAVATLWRVLTERSITPQNHQHLVEFALLIGMGMGVLVVSVILMGWFARRLSRDISDLETSARHLADTHLPQLVEQLRRGQRVAAGDEQPAKMRTKTAEIAHAAAAIASIQQTAVAAAAAEANLRNGIGQVFVSLARRNQSLLQRQLRLIDALEQKASDPAALADLFPLDHLTTRMRRHAEGLIILSGAAPGRSWSEPVPVIDVLRGAVAEVEDYKRVTVITSAEDAVAGSAVADMIHLLAELVENATLFSPSGMRVEIRAERVANGFAVEVEDRGLGIKTAQLNAINQRLATPPDFDLANADQLGLFVVGKLAARHGVRVSLRPSPYGGTSAIVLMPNSIVVLASELEAGSHREPRPAISGPPSLDLRSVETLPLADRQAQSSLSTASADRPTIGPDTFGLAGETSGLQPGSVGQPAANAGGGLPVRATGGQDSDATDALSLRGVAPDQPAPASATGPPAAQTYRGLPRRIRQASLSPHLREESPATGRLLDSDSTPTGFRTPEQARDLVASMQTGWLRGRQPDLPGGEGGPEGLAEGVRAGEAEAGARPTRGTGRHAETGTRPTGSTARETRRGESETPQGEEA